MTNDFESDRIYVFCKPEQQKPNIEWQKPSILNNVIPLDKSIHKSTVVEREELVIQFFLQKIPCLASHIDNCIAANRKTQVSVGQVKESKISISLE